MDMEEACLINIATAFDGYYCCDQRKAKGIFVVIQSNDKERLDQYRKTFGFGFVAPTAGGNFSHYDIKERTDAATIRGRFRWNINDEEAYIFCKKIKDHLYKYDKIRYCRCQEVISWYEDHTHRQARPSRPKSNRA